MTYNDWNPNVKYKSGELVWYNDSTYRCLQSHTSSFMDYPSFKELLWTNSLGGAFLKEDLKPWFVGKYYRKNECVIVSRVVYRCVTPHLADAFNIPPYGKWKEEN